MTVLTFLAMIFLLWIKITIQYLVLRLTHIRDTYPKTRKSGIRIPGIVLLSCEVSFQCESGWEDRGGQEHGPGQGLILVTVQICQARNCHATLILFRQK